MISVMNPISPNCGARDQRPPRNLLDLADRILMRAGQSWSSTFKFTLLAFVVFGCLGTLGYLLIATFRTVPSPGPILGLTGGVGGITILRQYAKRPKK